MNPYYEIIEIIRQQAKSRESILAIGKVGKEPSDVTIMGESYKNAAFASHIAREELKEGRGCLVIFDGGELRIIAVW